MNGDSELIEKLGNTSAVARDLALDRRVVSNWKQRGISADYRPMVQDLAKKKNIPVGKDFLAPEERQKAPDSQMAASIRADATLVNALGGPAIVAGTLGVDKRIVSNWKPRGIPANYRPKVKELAESKGVKVPKDFLAPRARRMSDKRTVSAR